MIALLLALAGQSPHPTPGQIAAATGPASWTAPAAPFKIVGDLYEVGSQGISAFALKTKDGTILLDAGMPAYAPTVIANLKAIGVQPQDVKIIVASHAHFDHAGGLAEVKRVTGAKLAIMDADVHWDETGTYPGRIDGFASFTPVKVDRVLHDGDTVSLGGETLIATKTAGHTPGCTTWTFPVREGGKTYTVMYQCSVSVAANVLVGSKTTHPGIVADYRASFAKLKTMKADVFLAPHPEQFGLADKKAKIAPGAPNPFVDPSELQRRVAAGEKAFEADLAKQEAAQRTTAASPPLPRSVGGVGSAATDGGGKFAQSATFPPPALRATSPAARERSELR